MSSPREKPTKHPECRGADAGPELVRKGHALVILGELSHPGDPLDYRSDPVAAIYEERIRALLGNPHPSPRHEQES